MFLLRGHLSLFGVSLAHTPIQCNCFLERRRNRIPNELRLRRFLLVTLSAAAAVGLFYLLLRYLLPCMLGTLTVNAATQLGVMMIGVAGLSFLGIGVTEPHAEWGSMINQSRAYMQLAPWATLAPAGATVVTVMVFNCLGDCLRDHLDVEAAK